MLCELLVLLGHELFDPKDMHAFEPVNVWDDLFVVLQNKVVPLDDLLHPFGKERSEEIGVHTLVPEHLAVGVPEVEVEDSFGAIDFPFQAMVLLARRFLGQDHER